MAEQPETSGERKKREPELMPCSVCGKPYARERQVRRLQKKLGDEEGLMELCPSCRRRRYAGSLLTARSRTTES
jgi:hypothetical protein